MKTTSVVYSRRNRKTCANESYELNMYKYTNDRYKQETGIL